MSIIDVLFTWLHSVPYISWLHFLYIAGYLLQLLIQIIEGMNTPHTTGTGITKNCMKTQEFFDIDMLWCNVRDYSRANLN